MVHKLGNQGTCDLDIRPIHIAAALDNILIIRLLIHFKVDVESKTSHGHTALHIASAAGQVKNVMMLVYEGKANVLAQSTDIQAPLFFVANGVLSMISDNVFVATVYINEIKAALDSGMITRDQFDKLAVAVNTGTNIPSIATPNGQAAFLFLLTSSLAPLINLSYMRMVIMALPYTLVLSTVGLFSVIYFL